MGKNSKARRDAKARARGKADRAAAGGTLPRPQYEPDESVPTGFSNVSMSRGFGGGRGTTADWDRLREEFLAEQPQCPDCGSDWDLDSASEEEGATDEAWVLSISAICAAYADDEDAGRRPVPHPRSNGIGDHELALPLPPDRDPARPA